MQAGFKDYLNHLNTKFVTRRSDIVVSSTLSITLTPIESNVIPTNFATLSSSDREEYIRKRNIYRTLKLSSNLLERQRRKQPKYKQVIPAWLRSISSGYVKEDTSDEYIDLQQEDNLSDS